MTDKKELNQEELDKVTGGTNLIENEFAKEYNVEITINDFPLHVGENALIIRERPEGNWWFIATILGVFEVSAVCVTRTEYRIKYVDLGNTTGEGQVGDEIALNTEWGRIFVK